MVDAVAQSTVEGFHVSDSVDLHYRGVGLRGEVVFEAVPHFVHVDATSIGKNVEPQDESLAREFGINPLDPHEVKEEADGIFCLLLLGWRDSINELGDIVLGGGAVPDLLDDGFDRVFGVGGEASDLEDKVRAWGGGRDNSEGNGLQGPDTMLQEERGLVFSQVVYQEGGGGTFRIQGLLAGRGGSNFNL